MYTTVNENDILTTMATIIILTSLTELLIMMCVCQFNRLVKRGDAARQEIQSIHSYHLERRSRSRSQSRIRTDYNNGHNNNNNYNPFIMNDRNTPAFRPVSPVSSSIVEQSMDNSSRLASLEPSNIKISSDNDSRCTVSYSNYTGIDNNLPPSIFLKLDR